ncbi:hypothetical protein L1281_002089 [Neisseria sp. HSC-16F19]|nr:hypothetical protein [Neisseria sp. HSC-16F19]MCP2041489.1 hypothetical protein [Neisseria sp. HSC-16F19]
MCAGCGILQNNRDWTEGFGQHDNSRLQAHERMAEKRRRIMLVNELLAPGGLKLSDRGGILILSGLTGKSVTVANLAHVWIEADRIGRVPPDPLAF